MPNPILAASHERRLRLGPAPVLLAASTLLVGISPAQQPTQPDRLEAMERRIAELEFQLDSIGPASDTSIRAAHFDETDLQATPELDRPTVSAATDIRLWGRAKVDVHIDNFQGRGFTDFATYVTAEGPDELNINPRDSRFGFAAQRSWDQWTARGVVELDFYGTNAGNNLVPRLRLGFVELEDDKGLSIRVGQDWIPIAQQNPGTIDFGILAWGGNLWWRVPQITVRKDFGPVKLLGGVMKHRISNTQERGERSPWVYGRVGYDSRAPEKHGGLLALNAAWKSIDQVATDSSAWLVAGEFAWDLPAGLSVKGEVWTGEGIGRTFLRYGLDLDSGGTAVSGRGGFASLGYRATNKLRLNFGLGIDDPHNSDLVSGTSVDGGTQPFQRNQVLFLNGRYQMSKNYGFGVEVLHFDTTQLSGADFDGQRVTLSNWFIF